MKVVNQSAVRDFGQRVTGQFEEIAIGAEQFAVDVQDQNGGFGRVEQLFCETSLSIQARVRQRGVWRVEPAWLAGHRGRSA